MSSYTGSTSLVIGQWTQVGVGPMSVQTESLSSGVLIAVSDNRPSLTALDGWLLTAKDPVIEVPSSSTVWAYQTNYNAPPGSVNWQTSTLVSNSPTAYLATEVKVVAAALPQGAATAAAQPALDADGGSLSHVTNFPTSFTVTQSGNWNIAGIGSLPSLPAGNNAIGSVTVSNLPATQAVSLSSLPALPSGSNTIGSVNQAGGPWSVSWSGQSVGISGSLPAGTSTIGNVGVNNFPAVQAVTVGSLPLPAGAAQDGNDGTGITAPTGGSGIRGWLSGIYQKLSGILSVTGTVSVGNTVNVSGSFYQATQPVSAVSLPLPQGAAIAANQPDLNADGGALAHITNFPATQPVSGSVNIINFPATQAVTGTFFQATQPVSLSALPSLPAGNNAIGSVAVSNFPATQVVTASSLPLPSGAAQDGTDATGVVAPSGASGIRGWLSGIYQKLSGVLSVSGTVSVTGTIPVTGDFYPVTQAVSLTTLPLPSGAALASKQPGLDNDGGALAHITNFPSNQAISGTVSVSNLPSTQAVSGTVAISNLPASQAVTGTVGINNFPSIQPVTATSLPLPAGAAQDGVDATSVTMPSGGSGIRGWLSGIYQRLSNPLAVTGSVGVSGTVPVTGSFYQAVQPVSIDSLPSLPAGSNPIGTVAINNFPTSQTVSGSVVVSNFPAEQPVSLTALPALPSGSNTIGNVGINNFPATQAVSGSVSITNLPATQAVSGTVSVSNFPGTQAVSLASLPLPSGASQDGVDGTGITAPTGGSGIRGWLSGIYKLLSNALTVTGSVSVNNLPATQTVSGSVSVSNLPATQAVSVASLPLPTNAAQDGVDATGVTTPTGGSGIRGWLSGIYQKLSNPLTVSGSVSVSNTVPVTGVFYQATQPVSGTVAISNLPVAQAVTQSGGWAVDATTTGLVSSSPPTYTDGVNRQFSLTMSGALRTDSSSVTQPVSLASLPSLPAGGNAIGSVTISNLPATQPVSGSVSISNFPSTQAVSGSVAVTSLPALATGSNAIGSVSVSNFPTTQSVSGSVSATQSGTWGVSGLVSTVSPSYTNGSTQLLSLTSTGSLRVDSSSTVQPVSLTGLPALAAGSNAIGSVSVSNFPTTQAVSGTVSVGNFPSTQVVSASSLPLPTGAATEAKQPALGVSGTPATDVLTVQGIAGGVALSVDGSGVTQPVSGTVAATQSGNWATRVQDGAGVSISSISDGAAITSLATAIGATNFVVSANNSTSVQLDASATFTGAIETIFNQQAISVLLTSDQPGILTLNQYIDLAGSRRISQWVFPIAAGLPFSRAFVANGNYFNLTFQNTGAIPTTTLNANTAYGTLPSASNLGNLPVALNEVNGAALALGQAAMSASLPVVLSNNQSAIPVTGSVVVAGGFEGQSIHQLLNAILIELKINNQYQHDLPRLLNSGKYSIDEPASFRNDPSIFNQ